MTENNNNTPQEQNLTLQINAQYIKDLSFESPSMPQALLALTQAPDININVDVKPGEFFTFLGPSGCGKTTTLRTITGFIEPVSGTVNVNGKDITHVPIEKRNIGIVFQSYALFPTMTVYDNIAFGLKIQKLKKDEIDRKVRDIARKVDLSDECRIDYAFDAEMMRQALGQFIGCDTVDIHVSGPTSPIMITARGTSDTALVLPTRYRRAA